MTPAHFALAVLLSIPAKPSRVPMPIARAETLAADVAFVAELGPVPFTGPAAREATALVLLVIAEHEGAHFDPRVERCDIVADQGRTVSLFGLMRGASWRGYAREDLCQGGPLPAYLALAAFNGYQERCLPMPMSWFRGYASGSCSVKSDAATRMCHRWERLAKRHGIEGASCWSSGGLAFRAAASAGPKT